MFSPLDILYIVLAFCILWLTAGLFWLIWQVASILRNINVTMADAREKMAKIETAITGLKTRFEKATSIVAVLVDGMKTLVEYGIEKKFSKTVKKKTGK